jgi:hypothetical protein
MSAYLTEFPAQGDFEILSRHVAHDQAAVGRPLAFTQTRLRVREQSPKKYLSRARSGGSMTVLVVFLPS